MDVQRAAPLAAQKAFQRAVTRGAWKAVMWASSMVDYWAGR